ncbi:DUF4169 family protein [Rhizobium grahamii]|uniref:DUF4169 domain-containing protein n=2 Tax=Rhizobium grahamii TaxID=1120045 RepID=S3HG05_9HYPH|nr:DUF4169 family protein [Rhizobium grahamii]EPE97649.1 hypothetical protein RGCCGE502_12249 [Rhizobium grahamii CCGE 502]
MTAEVVNLRQFKKKQARADKEKQAEQNRISFGRTKVEKQLTKALNEKAERSHQQGHIEKSDDDK